jgi:hypothetical protein
MTDLEPVRPRATVLRGARRVVVPDRWSAVASSGSRALVASRLRALATGPLLPVSALAVTAAAAARAVTRVARQTRWSERIGREVRDRSPGPLVPGATLQVSWTHLEIWAGRAGPPGSRPRPGPPPR